MLYKFLLVFAHLFIIDGDHRSHSVGVDFRNFVLVAFEELSKGDLGSSSSCR